MRSRAEQLLWSQSELSDSDWSAIAEYLRVRLEEYLGQPVQMGDVDVVDHEALSCSIRCIQPIGGPLHVQWRGILGTEIIEGIPHVSATLFLFSRGRRLQVKGLEGSTVELIFSRGDEDSGYWEFVGWESDVYGEWEGIDSLE